VTRIKKSLSVSRDQRKFKPKHVREGENEELLSMKMTKRYRGDCREKKPVKLRKKRGHYENYKTTKFKQKIPRI